jgi:sulfatase maturation enzyme AslB (radical SAM superfamily)
MREREQDDPPVVKKRLYTLAIGGEPLLAPDLIDVFCSRIDELQNQFGFFESFILTIATNGTLLLEPDVLKVLEKWKRYLWLQVSIDGDRETHDTYRAPGTWDLIVKNAQTLRGEGFKMSAKATYFHNDYRNWKNGVIALIESGFNNLNANVGNEEPWIEGEEEIFFPQMKEVIDYIFSENLIGKVYIRDIMRDDRKPRYCDFPNMFCLSFDRKISTCLRMAIAYNQPAVGVLEGKSIKITNPEFYENFKREYCEQTKPDRCKNCKTKCHTCLGASQFLGLSGSEAYKTSCCGYLKAIARARDYYLEKLCTPFTDAIKSGSMSAREAAEYILKGCLDNNPEGYAASLEYVTDMLTER